MIRARRFPPILCVLAGFLVAGAGILSAQPDPSLFSGMRWRLVGPFRGGRTVTAVGVPGAPDRFYFGAVGGGVWKTENAGRTWEPIFDSQPVASIGAIAVAPSDPNVLYVGSGEADMRSDISYGNGVYRSADAGKTWSRVGLTDSRQIGRIAIDPKDPNLVFVAALGHAYGPNRERGLFRSKDGGRTWACVLCKGEDTGAIDVALDPTDPRKMLAALWQTRRPPWNVYPPSNGPGSGLYRSTDGGDTWTPVHGIPSEKLGRIRLAFAPSEPRRVYAIVDASANEGGLYVSEDAGATWTRRSPDRRIWQRGWYFGGVTVDPKNADVVYACNTAMYKSTDGGRTFLPFKGAPGGDDYHRLWIDPGDSRRMIFASDQGAAVSVDAGATWSSWYNQATAQLYHVATDDRFPYWIYGAQQDSGAVAIPSRTDYRSITNRDWKEIAAGGENDFVAPDPKDPNILWGGRVDRFDLRTLQEQRLDPTLAHPLEDRDGYRGEWTLPLVISPWSGRPKAVYFGNQFVWRTVDDGRHWEKISADLTRESPGVPPTLDPITAKDSQAKGPRRGVVYAIAPSPLAEGQIWCGTDDGLIWLTRDDGKSWKNVTPKDLTAWSKVGILEASRFDRETAYAAIDRHRVDDVRPYILRTRDGGKTWTWISKGIPDGSFVNVVREDPARRGLLYAGTETGVFVSFDDGERWQPLQLNLPNCSVRDIDVRHGDLVVATHGRSFWVLDDLSPLHQIDAAAQAAASSGIFLYAPREAVGLHPAQFLGTPEPKDEPMAANPPSGAVIDYWIQSAASRLTLEILDAGGGLVRRFASDDAVRAPDLQRIQTTADWAPAPEPPSAAAGMHRFVWDLRAELPKELVSPRSRDAGPRVPPGRYTVRLTAGDRTQTQTLVVSRDPRLPGVTDPDLERRFALAKDIQAERVRVAAGLAQADALRRQIQALRGKAPGGAAARAVDALSRAFERVAGPPPSAFGEEAEEDVEVEPTNLRGVAASLSQLQSAVESADAAPTPDAQTAFGQRRDLAARSLARWKEWLSAELPKLNAALEGAGLSALRLP